MYIKDLGDVERFNDAFETSDKVGIHFPKAAITNAVSTMGLPAGMKMFGTRVANNATILSFRGGKITDPDFLNELFDERHRAN